MTNIPISALPNVQPSGYTPNDLLVLVNYDLPSGTTKNTSLFDISNYVLSGVTFTGNTSATCITDLYVSNVYGCSPITIHDSVQSIGSQATGVTSFAFGDGVSAFGNYSHAEGYNTISSGQYSHSEGDITQSIGVASHSEGQGTISSGQSSHAEGNQTQSIGDYSHAEGESTQSVGYSSHAEGIGTIASGAYQHVSGRFNESGDTTSAAFIIGNGNNDTSRSNLLFAAGNEVNISGKTITTNFQMTSGATDNYVLTSDSLGNGSWEEITTITGLTFNNGTYDLTVNTNTGNFTQSLYILAGDMTVTGGTYNPSTGDASFTTNSGGTFNVSGFLTGYTDTNIYTVDGSLTGNRIVDLSGYTLTFNDDIIIEGVYFGKGSGSGSNIRIGDSLTFSLNTIGDSNIAMGYGALTSNDSGNGNVSIGRENLYQNQIGNYNVSIGNESLYSNFQGTSNTSVGHQSLYSNNNGFNNTSVGYQAGYDVQTGGNNTFIGNGTGGGIVGGNFNTIIGANVTGLAMSLSNNIIIADGQGNQRINVDNTGNVGIGTTTPTELLDVSGKTKTINFQMTSGATNGYLLTSDASGNASWQSPSGVSEYTLTFMGTSLNPLDSTTYYVGATANAPITTDTNVQHMVPKTGKITKVAITSRQTSGSSQNSIFSVGVNGVYTQISNTIKFNGNPRNSSLTTGLNISVSEGDLLTIRWLCPIWLPNPTGVVLNVTLFMQ